VTGTTGNREQMRMQRSRDEIAEDVVAEFGLRMARARILLDGVASLHRRLQRHRPPNIKAVRAAVEKDQEWLQKRGKRRAREFPTMLRLVALYDKAAFVLDKEKIQGPDVRFRWLDDYCARVAYEVIAHSRNRRMGDRLRTLAGYLYEAATGIPNRRLDTACRRVTAEKERERAL
jgi:hypothetical protein